ncbi:uncharacterized protein LOC133340872 isoform X1 [Lethenteron reissneri]|uniref:uncharacterized protein LOC133340872 isoform X1 n=1 Tax=Lethenteron reissneri TaxID=7753 RepID=UPI002AB6DF3B|nr:uncharacterized protein LOC133340872 isoform X1 [Lethenteron reissneri]
MSRGPGEYKQTPPPLHQLPTWTGLSKSRSLAPLHQLPTWTGLSKSRSLAPLHQLPTWTGLSKSRSLAPPTTTANMDWSVQVVLPRPPTPTANMDWSVQVALPRPPYTNCQHGLVCPSRAPSPPCQTPTWTRPSLVPPPPRKTIEVNVQLGQSTQAASTTTTAAGVTAEQLQRDAAIILAWAKHRRRPSVNPQRRVAVAVVGLVAVAALGLAAVGHAVAAAAVVLTAASLRPAVVVAVAAAGLAVVAGGMAAAAVAQAGTLADVALPPEVQPLRRKQREPCRRNAVVVVICTKGAMVEEAGVIAERRTADGAGVDIQWPQPSPVLLLLTTKILLHIEVSGSSSRKI